jgi:hypothetical protein
MALPVAQLTLYCARPVCHVTSKDVLTGMDYGRLAAEAEDWGLTDQAEIDSALAHLRIRTEKGERKTFVIYFRPEEQSAVLISMIRAPEAIKALRESALRSLAGAEGADVERIRERLGRTVGYVSVLMGWDAIDAGHVFGWLAAGFLARLGDALLVDQFDNWLTFESGPEPVWLYRPEHAD